MPFAQSSELPPPSATIESIRCGTAKRAPAAAMFAILTKVGVYSVLRLWTLCFPYDAGESALLGGPLLLWGGFATVLFGATGMLASQQLGRLLDCLDKLPDRSREAIWLRRIEGLSQREAAQHLGIMEKTLAGYLSRGLDLLARYILSDEPREASAESDGQVHRTEHG